MHVRIRRLPWRRAARAPLRDEVSMRRIALITAGLIASVLVACTQAPAPTPAVEEQSAPPVSVSTPNAGPESAPAPPESRPTPRPAPVTPASEAPPQMSEPLPAEPVPATSDKRLLVTGSGATRVDGSCRTNADCAIKDVGSCCGESLACVSVTTPVDPRGVQRECARTGMVSTCGAPTIESCTCNAGRCTANSAGSP